jgi:hypothetical protein
VSGERSRPSARVARHAPPAQLSSASMLASDDLVSVDVR